MSEQKKSSQDRKNNSRIWMVVSLLVTVMILGWAFSLPFRSGLSFVDANEESVSVAGDRTGQRSVESSRDAEEFRAAAIAMEDDFMRELKERNRLKDVPGKKEVMLHWQKHVESVKKQIADLGDPEKGTMEWDDKQTLIESLQDGPLN